jgi:methylase of polypeptide subunit release factors
VRFEPKTALVAADGGLADLAHIIREGRRYLAAGGVMLLEHGWTQGKRCAPLSRGGLWQYCHLSRLRRQRASDARAISGGV